MEMRTFVLTFPYSLSEYDLILKRKRDGETSRERRKGKERKREIQEDDNRSNRGASVALEGNSEDSRGTEGSEVEGKGEEKERL